MSLFNELKRRNVIRVAAAYVVIGWLLLQVADTLTPALHLPEWIVSAIALVLILGIIPVFLFSWAYELTPDGIKKDSEVDSSTSEFTQTAKKLDLITIISIVGIAALIAWQQMNPSEHKGDGANQVGSSKAVSASTIADASIAVLPFADLSQAGDQEYFSDGISEEILNVLVQVDALKVASRTSSFGYKGQEALGIPLIAKRLNVRHVLEGSVRKAGDTIRITAQLIDAQTDQHLWSQTFDRTLTTKNIFIIQDEISKAIVKQLGLVLNNNSEASTQNIKVTTENFDAYELYLEGNALFKFRNVVNITLAINKFEKAVELDPNFAKAWSKLAASYGVATSWLGSSGRDFEQLSSEAIARAIKLNPDLSLPYGIRGANFANLTPAQFKEAMADYDKALARDPNNTNVYLWRAENYVSLGFFAKAEKDLLRCIELEPERTICKPWLGKVYFHQGRYKLGFKVYEDAISAGSYNMLDDLIFQYAMHGNNEGARLALALNAQGFGDNSVGTDAYYRALTDENFDFDKDVKEFELKSKAVLGEEKFNQYDNYYFKRYQDMKVNLYLTAWWQQYDQDFLRSPYRKQLIRKAGVYQYWREVEFPPQCRAIGEDDFECD